MSDTTPPRFIGRGAPSQPEGERKLRETARAALAAVSIEALVNEAAVRTAQLPDDGPRLNVDLEDGSPPRTLSLMGIVTTLVGRAVRASVSTPAEAPRTMGPLLLGPHIPETDA